MGGLKKRCKDSFLTLISNTNLFIIHPTDNIICANKGCNDILFDNIMLWDEFKFETSFGTYTIFNYMYTSNNKRFTTTKMNSICYAVSPQR